ncbi:MAG: DUF4330 family protein [Clostridia bacterium]|nr:DUF4330 family protein [Clostridia bacterium]
MDKIKIGKLNLLDIIIILLLILCVAFAVFKFMPKKNVANGEEQSNSFSYTIRVEGISNTSADMIKVGDNIYDKVTNTQIGTITDLKIESALALIEDLDGKYIKSEMPGKIDVDITVETDGKVQNGEYIANGLIRILVGQTKEVKTKYWMATGFVTQVNN